MPVLVEKLRIEGLLSIRPKVFGDDRGYFVETWNKAELAAAGLRADFVQDNQSKSVRGILRGLHYQVRHPQGKLVRAIQGEVYDVAVDLRPGSPSYGKWESVILSATAQNQLFIPAGFAHGFLVLSDEAVFAYKCTDYYHPEDEAGIVWNDPDLAIGWPDVGIPFRTSGKDAALPRFGSHA